MNLSRMGFTVAASCFVAGTALAADLPSRAAPPIFALAPPIFTWTGFYAGVNAGYVVDGTDRLSLAGLTPGNIGGPTTYATLGQPTLSSNGFTGGGQIGYNYQFGVGNGVVVGLEADAAYTDLDNTRNFPVPAGAGRVFRSELDYLGTVRGRLGYAFDQILVYGTGGFAYGGSDDRVSLLNIPDTVVRFGGERDGMQTGYAVGGGIEYALPAASFLAFMHPGAMTIKAEYLHYDLGSTVVRANPNPATDAVGAYSARFETAGDLARVGLNYKF